MQNILNDLNLSITGIMDKLKRIDIFPAYPKNHDELMYAVSDWLIHHSLSPFTVILNMNTSEYASLDTALSAWDVSDLNKEYITAIVLSPCSDSLYEKIKNDRELYMDCVYKILDKIHSLAVVRKNCKNLENVTALLSLFAGEENDSYALSLASVFQVKESNVLREDIINDLSKTLVLEGFSYRCPGNVDLLKGYIPKAAKELSLYCLLTSMTDEQYSIVRFFIEQNLWTSVHDTAYYMRHELYLNFLSIPEMFTYYASTAATSHVPALCISDLEHHTTIGDELEDYVNTPSLYDATKNNWTPDNTAKKPDGIEVVDLNSWDYYKIRQMKSHLLQGGKYYGIR